MLRRCAAKEERRKDLQNCFYLTGTLEVGQRTTNKMRKVKIVRTTSGPLSRLDGHEETFDFSDSFMITSYKTQIRSWEIRQIGKHQIEIPAWQPEPRGQRCPVLVHAHGGNPPASGIRGIRPV